MENTKFLKKNKLIILSIILLLLVLTSNIFGRGWICYHDGPYKGKVVDAETGEAIDGAVVLGEWPLEHYGGPAGPIITFCDAQETVTDKNGEFKVPRAFCFHIWPFTKMGEESFKVFKPGYDSYPPSLPVLKSPVTKEISEAAQKYKHEYIVDIKKGENNLIKLKSAKDKTEREWIVNHISLIRIPDNMRQKKAKQMIDLINKDCKSLDLQPFWRDKE